ncbi:hypothetical protein [Caballeronia sp. 15711]|uniref:hypothetical protein n=1 Tax=Caballeronia sp. 15711 TaxID=3391029 RepID=UPI0039E2E837
MVQISLLEPINAARATLVKIGQPKITQLSGEQEHRSIKLKTWPMLRLKTFRCTLILLAGIEIIYMVEKADEVCLWNPSASTYQFYEL